MAQKGHARVERGAKIMKEGHFLNRMRRRGRERGPENPGEVGTAPLLNRGFTEGNHLGFCKRDFNAISLTPELGVVHKVEELGSRVAKEAEIIHEEEDGNEDEKGGGGNNDVREPGLEGAHKVRDVKTPKQRGKPTTLSEALEKGGEGIGRVVTMEDPNFDGEMKGSEMLPDDIRNAIVSEDKQQLLTKYARESQRNVPKEDVRGTAKGSFAVEVYRTAILACKDKVCSGLGARAQTHAPRPRAATPSPGPAGGIVRLSVGRHRGRPGVRKARN
jgi:hypothetical protein